LGLALGKSQREIRNLPNPEYRRWQLLYMLEPWGWQDREYRMAAILAMLNNVNVGKKKDTKQPAYFMRDMQDLITRNLFKKEDEPDLSQMAPEERKALAIKSMKEFFGV
jgi:hypothetical protein